jgi:hypothetical protein
MRLFTETPVLKWLAVSIGAHLLILGMTSMGYIRDRWIDPEGVKARAEAKAAATNAPPATAATVEPAAATTPAAAAAASTSTSVPPASATASAVPATQGPRTEAQLLEERKNAPVVQRITDTAAPQEIPRQPDELGLSLEDTRR